MDEADKGYHFVGDKTCGALCDRAAPIQRV